MSSAEFNPLRSSITTPPLGAQESMDKPVVGEKSLRSTVPGNERTKEVGTTILQSTGSAAQSSPIQGNRSVRANTSMFKGVKNFFLKVLGNPINGDLVLAKTIEGKIKDLESDVKKYQQDLKSEKPMSSEERKKLAASIQSQTTSLRGTSGNAKSLAKGYSACKSYPKKIENALSSAREIKNREQIDSSLEAMQDALKLEEGSTQIEKANIMKDKLQKNQEIIFKSLEEMIKSNPNLAKQIQNKVGEEPLTRADLQKALDIISPDFAKKLEKARQSGTEILKAAQTKNFQSETQAALTEITNLSPQVVDEMKVKSDEQLKTLTHIFRELVATESTFRSNLEELTAYRQVLDFLIANPKELKKMDVDLSPEVMKELRDCIDQNAQLLSTVGPFSDEISKLTSVREFPKLAQQFVAVNFSLILDAESNQKRFGGLMKEGSKIGDEIRKLDKIIKNKNNKVGQAVVQKAGAKFSQHPQLQAQGVDSSMIAVIQRPPRYVLLFGELAKHSPQETSMLQMTQKCQEHAKRVATGINEYGRI